MKRLAWILVPWAACLATACRESAPPPAESENDEDAAADRILTLSEDVMRAAGLEVVVVSREAFHPHVIASGVIRPDAQKEVVVRARVAGRIVAVLADLGDSVRAGMPLARIEGPDVTAAIARYRSASARENVSREALARAERLLEMKAISRAERDRRRAEAEAEAAEAEAARQDLLRLGIEQAATSSEASPTESPAELTVTAPLSGIVLERNVSPGLLVEKDAPLFAIAELSRVWAVADVYEKDLGQLQESGEVEVKTDAYPGEVFTGRIALVEPALDEASRTAHVRVALDNREGKLRPGLFVTVAIPLAGTSDVEATAVPEAALQKISGVPAVFVELAPGRFELRPVEIGREAHGMVEIRHGLRDGERVAAAGAFVLKSELLKGAIEGEEH